MPYSTVLPLSAVKGMFTGTCRVRARLRILQAHMRIMAVKPIPGAKLSILKVENVSVSL